MTSVTLEERETRFYSEVASGNIPRFLRNLKPVSVTTATAGVLRTATFYVTSDYLSIGSDADFLRIPATPALAQRIGDLTSCSLPTRKMVNDIYSQATVKLHPHPLPPGPLMGTMAVFCEHNKIIEAQKASTGASPDALIGGIKKDVVITPLLTQRPPPPRVAIYGWHRLSGLPIQPLSLVHHSHYADYSHGVRLVSQQVIIDGTSTTLEAALTSSSASILLSDEGVVQNLRY